MNLQQIKKKAVGKHSYDDETSLTFLGDSGKLETEYLLGGLLGSYFDMQYYGSPEKEFAALPEERNWVSWKGGRLHRLHVGSVCDPIRMTREGHKGAKNTMLAAVWDWGTETGRQLWKAEGWCVNGSGYLFEDFDDAKLYAELHVAKHADQVEKFLSDPNFNMDIANPA